MTRALAPLTPYEHVLAENLIAIEWELIQHRRMRDAGLRRIMSDAIREAVVARENAAHEAGLDEEWAAHVEAGGTEDDFRPSASFERDAAEAMGRALAARAVSRNCRGIRSGLRGDRSHGARCRRPHGRGVSLLQRVGRELTTSRGGNSRAADARSKRDFDALRKVRPVEAEVIEG